jgi:hypothetical protein
MDKTQGSEALIFDKVNDGNVKYLHHQYQAPQLDLELDPDL